MKSLFFAVLTACLLPLATLAQFKLSGTVRDRSTAQPISGANIKIAGRPGTAVTDHSGAFTLPGLEKGAYKLTVSHVSFTSAEKDLWINKDTEITMELNPASFITEEVLVTSTRASKSGVATYKNISKEEIALNNFGQDLPFIIQNTPGVVVTSDAGTGIGYTGIRIRGSDPTRVNVTLNGIPYNDSESQGTFWVNMPDFASSVENIQIQRGVGSSTNGAGSFGGSINVQTSAISNEAYAELNNTLGSFGTLRNTVKVGTGLIGEHFSFEGRLSRIKSEGFVDRASSDLKSYFLSGAYQTSKSLLRLNVFSGTETTYQAWNGVPEAKLRNDRNGILDYIARNGVEGADSENLLNSDSRRYNSFLYRDQTDNYWQDHYQALFGSALSDQLSLNLAAHYTYGRGYYEEFKPGQRLESYGLSPVNIGGTVITRTDLVRRRWLDNDFYGMTFGLNYTPGANFTATLGGGYNRYAGDHFGQVIYATYGSTGDNNRHYYDNLGEKSDFNSFIKADFSLREGLRLFVDAQIRSIQYRINGTDKSRLPVLVDDQLTFFNPKLGLSATISEGQQVYGSLSIASKEPNRDDYLNFENGRPGAETLRNVELGYRLENNRFNLGINAYGMFYKDQLVVTGKINDVGEYFRQNVEDSYRTGLEADAALLLSPKWQINLNAALSRNKIRNFVEYTDDYDNGGQQEIIYKRPDISFSPALVAGSELVFKPFGQLALALQSRYVSDQYLDNTQNEQRKLDAYFVSNLRIGYNFRALGAKNIHFGLLINNLFNERYESNGYTFGYIAGAARVTENFYFPQAGTNVLGSLNIRF